MAEKVTRGPCSVCEGAHKGEVLPTDEQVPALNQGAASFFYKEPDSSVTRLFLFTTPSKCKRLLSAPAHGVLTPTLRDKKASRSHFHVQLRHLQIQREADFITLLSSDHFVKGPDLFNRNCLLYPW